MTRRASSGCALAAAALIVLVVPATPASACLPDPEDPPVSVDAPVLAVTVAPDRARRRAGETARLKVEVRLGGPAESKAEGADVAVVLSSGGVVVRKLYGVTDETGAFGATFRVPRGAPKPESRRR